MEAIQHLKNRLIDQIMKSSNIELLSAIETLLKQKTIHQDVVYFTDEQKKLLTLSEDDIQYGRLISDDDLLDEDEEWMNK